MTIERPRGRRLVASALGTLLAATLFVAQPAAAAAPLILDDPAYPSAISDVDGWTYLLQSEHMVCVAFVNHGPRTATKVGLSLAFVDAQGTVLGVDVMYPRGVFPVGKRSAFALGTTNCDSTRPQRQALTSTFTYNTGKTGPPTPVAAILVSAREIVYDDGTAFRTDHVPQSGDHETIPTRTPSAAVPAGPPVVSPGAEPGAPFVVDDALLVGFLFTNFGVYVAWTFTNHSTAGANKVRIDLELVDRTGKVGGVVETYAQGTFAPGVLIDNTPGAHILLQGKWDADTFIVHPRGGEPVAAGRIIAVPVRIDFTDGTSWQAAHPPHIGDPADLPS